MNRTSTSTGAILLLMVVSFGICADEPRLVMLDGQGPVAGQDESSKWEKLNPKKLKLRSEAALIIDKENRLIYSRNPDQPMPIASITKLMTAMVIIDSGVSLERKLTVTKQDRDLVKLTGSRLKYGASLSRRDLLRLALMASENRAAKVLARTFPGGEASFVRRMNEKAEKLGMANSRFTDSAGLDAGNLSTARDLVKLVRAAESYPLIREASTTRSMQVSPYRKLGPLRYGNTNRLLKNAAWDIELSKTGYTSESGRCLVMQAQMHGSSVTIVLLNSFGKLTPFGDSNRLRRWIESGLGKS